MSSQYGREGEGGGGRAAHLVTERRALAPQHHGRAVRHRGRGLHALVRLHTFEGTRRVRLVRGEGRGVST